MVAKHGWLRARRLSPTLPPSPLAWSPPEMGCHHPPTSQSPSDSFPTVNHEPQMPASAVGEATLPTRPSSRPRSQVLRRICTEIPQSPRAFPLGTRFNSEVYHGLPTPPANPVPSFRSSRTVLETFPERKRNKVLLFFLTRDNFENTQSINK